jgi:hypothetical protein
VTNNMLETKDNIAVEEQSPEDKPKPPKPPGFREFEKLLKHVINAPPLRKHQDDLGTAP